MLLLSQATGLAIAAALALAGGGAAPAGEHVAYAALSGVAGLMGLSAFYRGMAVGAMSVVAPISATAAVIPVIVGVASGERPSSLQAAGVALALAGVVLVSREAPGRPSERGGGALAAGAGLALLAAAGFGSFFVAMDAASDGGVFWAILVNRLTGVSLLALTALALRPALAVGPPELRALLAVGALDMTANALFAVGSTEGLVSVVAVLASLYPVMVIALARLLLGERVRRVQQLGALGALAGVVLISAG